MQKEEKFNRNPKISQKERLILEKISKFITLSGRKREPTYILIFFCYILTYIFAGAQAAYFSLNHDVGGFLLDVRGIQEKRAYNDINMPTNLWLPYISIFIQKYTSFYLADIHKLVIFVFAIFCNTLTTILIGVNALSITSFAAILGTTSALLILPAYDFGQREHIFALTCAPLFALQYNKISELRSPKILVLFTTSAAAFGATQKPFFIMFLLGLGVISCIFKSLRVFLPELILVYIFIVLILVLSVGLYPAYFSETLPMAFSTYGTMRLAPSLALIMALITPITAIKLFFANTAIIGLKLSIFREPKSNFTQLFAYFFIGLLAWIIALVQRFCYDYHFLPFKIFVAVTSLIIFACLIDAIIYRFEKNGFSSKHALWTRLFFTLIYLIIILDQLRVESKFQISREDIINDPFTKSLQTLPPRTPILMLSTRVTPITPIHAYSSIRWTGEFPNLFILLAILNNQSENKSIDLVEAEEILLRGVNGSFRAPSPDFVFVDVSKSLENFLNFRHPDILAYLYENDTFKKIWRNYRLIGHIETIYKQELDVYQRISSSTTLADF